MLVPGSSEAGEMVRVPAKALFPDLTRRRYMLFPLLPQHLYSMRLVYLGCHSLCRAPMAGTAGANQGCLGNIRALCFGGGAGGQGCHPASGSQKCKEGNVPTSKFLPLTSFYDPSKGLPCLGLHSLIGKDFFIQRV